MIDDDAPTVVFPVLPLPDPAVSGARPRRRVADRLLTVAAIVGAFCLILTVAALAFGIRPVIFETGSMSPAIPAGSLGVSRTVPAADVHPGDVVGVTRDDGIRVTHRVVSVTGLDDGRRRLVLQGDANPVADAQPYTVDRVTRVYVTAPWLGYVAAWLKNPYTLAMQVVALLALFAIAFAPRRGWRNTPLAGRLLAGTAAATVAVVAASGTHGTGPAQAALNDAATVTGTVTTARPNRAPSVQCVDYPGALNLLAGAADLKIANPAPANGVYSYELRIAGRSGVLTTVGPTTANPVTVRIANGLLAALVGTLTGNSGPWTVEVYSKVGNFYSATAVLVPIKMALLPLLSVQCNPEGTYPGSAPLARRLTGPESTSESASAPSSSTPATASAPPIDSSSTSSPAPSVSGSPSATASTTTASTTAPSTTTSAATTASSTAPAPTLPPGGTPSASGAFAFYRDGGSLTVRDATSAEVVYRGSFPSSSTVRWLPGTEELEITEPDGTVVVVSRTGTEWVEHRTPPPAAASEVPVAK
ncbi:MAG: signal peptidase I [Gordonia sp. (in: high G+C Gram-positive bacteria)]|uniref:signal peptidase I n=1 Tax=Gordonia sp. (in: high G+C Gram-positive bacteria) TaxID=84139 RepID=UPI003C7774C7